MTEDGTCSACQWRMRSNMRVFLTLYALGEHAYRTRTICLSCWDKVTDLLDEIPTREETQDNA